MLSLFTQTNKFNIKLHRALSKQKAYTVSEALICMTEYRQACDVEHMFG